VRLVVVGRSTALCSGEQAVGGCGKKNFCVSPRTTKHRAAAASNNDEHPNSIAQQQENT